MFNLGGGEITVILILALIFIGPKRLPEIGRTLGEWTRKAKRAMDELKDSLDG